MPVNPDFANQATVTFRDPPTGSCITKQFLQELALLMQIELPASSTGSKICTSSQAGNLASLDAENCVYVPADLTFDDELNWLAAAPQDITFSGWSSAIDATAATLVMTPLFSPTDFGSASVDEVSRTKTAVTYRVTGATQDVAIRLQIIQPSIAPQQS